LQRKIKEERQWTYKRNTEERSCNHCCLGKAISMTSWVCVYSLSYPAWNAQAPC